MSQKNLFLYFRKRNFLIFSKKSFLSISWNGIFLTLRMKKFRKELPSSKSKKPTIKKCLIFLEVKLSSLKLNIVLVFPEGTRKSGKTKKQKKIRPEEIFYISTKIVLSSFRDGYWLSHEIKIFILQDDYFS